MKLPVIPPGDLRLKHKVFVIALAPDEYEGLTEIQYRGKFSVTVPASAGTAGQGRWAIIVQREGRKRTITHLGFARSTGRVSSIDRRITVEPIEALAAPVPLDSLQPNMAAIHFGSLRRGSNARGAELTANASRDLIRALTEYVSEGLWLSMLPTGGRPTDIETIHAQYDALGTGLAIAGIDPGILQDRAYRGIEYSVLEIIRPSPTEPDLIAQDMQHFGWTRSREVNEHVRRIEDNGRILDVVNLNATKQEAATGVDLLYYNETFESFIGVQYKLADAHGDRLSGVDERMTSQIARMLRVESLGRAPVSPTEHRLGGSLMMFMKFARPADVRVQVSGMAKGWYVPAVYADALIEAGRAIGSRGGATFTLKNLDRWLSNEQFTHLARDGWIGSVGVRAAALRDYIDTALAERRSVMLMESSTTYPT